jgi:hypothetical protein
VYSYFVFFAPLAATLSPLWQHGVTGLDRVAFLNVSILIAVALLLVGLFMWVRSGRTLAPVVFLLALLLPVIFLVAQYRAGVEARSIRRGEVGPTVRVHLKKSARGEFSPEVLAANDRGSLYLLLETKDRYYLLDQPEGEPTQLPYASVYSLAKSDIVFAETAVQSVSRGGTR